jgi:hypothetical protein
VVACVAGRVEEAERPAAELEREAVGGLDHARPVDRNERAVVAAHDLVAVDLRRPRPEPARVDHVARAAGVDDELRVRQQPHHLARAAGMVEWTCVTIT